MRNGGLVHLRKTSPKLMFILSVIILVLGLKSRQNVQYGESTFHKEYSEEIVLRYVSGPSQKLFKPDHYLDLDFKTTIAGLFKFEYASINASLINDIARHSFYMLICINAP